MEKLPTDILDVNMPFLVSYSSATVASRTRFPSVSDVYIGLKQLLGMTVLNMPIKICVCGLQNAEAEKYRYDMTLQTA